MAVPQRYFVRLCHTLKPALLLLLTVLSAGVAVNGPARAASPAWSLTGPMSTARIHHTLTALPNGFVLVTGGTTTYPALTALETAEVYSPVSKSFVTVGSMATARVGHTATLLPDGKVLVTGGTDGTIEQFSAELFSYGIPSGFTPTGSMGGARAYHTATLLPSGQVLLAGGQKGNVALSLSQLYDPAGGQFTATSGQMQVGRYNHSATLLPNGKVLVTGGQTISGDPLGSAELYDPATGTWSLTDPMVAKSMHSATLLRNGKVFVPGAWYGAGLQPQLYDPSTGTWTNINSSAGADIGSHAVLLWDGKVLISSGLYSEGDFVLYDPVTDSFGASDTMVVARHLPSTARLNDGSVLASGGLVTNGQTVGGLASAEIYAPTPPPSAGLPPLLAFYPFEGDAQDASGNDRHGTTIGAPTVVSHGYEGQAYLFHGAGDYIAAPLNINPTSYPRLTMGCWAKTSAATPNQAVLNNDNGGFDRYLGIDNRGGGVGWSAFTGSGGVLGAVPAVLNAWTFMAVMYDQPNQTVRLQVEDMVYIKTGVNLGEGLQQLFIGASPSFNVFFNGVVDNVFVFGDVLTDQQLAYIRSRGAQGILGKSGLGSAIGLLLSDD